MSVAAQSVKCPGCGYHVFEFEPCAICANPEKFFGACTHGVSMNKVCVRCEAAIMRSQVEGSVDPVEEFYKVLAHYREAVPYRYAGILSECFEQQRRRIERAEEAGIKLELVVYELRSRLQIAANSCQ